MNQKHLESIQKINQIESVFLQNLTWLIYCLPVKYFDHISYNFPHQEEIDELIKWTENSDYDIKNEEVNRIPLGKYAERLVYYYLKNNEHFELLAANLQLIEDNKITIGELDYLFNDKTLDDFIHLEFSIKYYLKTTQNQKTIFLGPSTKDYLSRKVKKLLNHQTKLSQSHKHLFPKNLQDIKFKSRAIMKGCLFYPWKDWIQKDIKNETNEGWWLNIDQIEDLISNKNRFSLIREKLNWIFPYSRNQELITYKKMSEFAKDYLRHSNEIMVVRFNEKKIPIDRGFVMRSNWPR